MLSLTYTVEKGGALGLFPCGTPKTTCLGGDETPSQTVCWVLFVRKRLSQLFRGPVLSQYSVIQLFHNDVTLIVKSRIARWEASLSFFLRKGVGYSKPWKTYLQDEEGNVVTVVFSLHDCTALWFA